MERSNENEKSESDSKSTGAENVAPSSPDSELLPDDVEDETVTDESKKSEETEETEEAEDDEEEETEETTEADTSTGVKTGKVTENVAVPEPYQTLDELTAFVQKHSKGTIYLPKTPEEGASSSDGRIMLWSNTAPMKKNKDRWAPYRYTDWMFDPSVMKIWPPPGREYYSQLSIQQYEKRVVSHVLELSLQTDPPKVVEEHDPLWPHRTFAEINDLDRALCDNNLRLMHKTVEEKATGSPTISMQEYFAIDPKKKVDVVRRLADIIDGYVEMKDAFDALREFIKEAKSHLNKKQIEELVDTFQVVKQRQLKQLKELRQTIVDMKNECEGSDSSVYETVLKFVCDTKKRMNDLGSKNQVFGKWYQQSRLRKLLGEVEGHAKVRTENEKHHRQEKKRMMEDMYL